VGFLNSIIQNKAIAIPFLAWMTAQAIKVITHLITEKRFDFSRFVSSGGMPSSHSALTVSLAVVVGRTNG